MTGVTEITVASIAALAMIVSPLWLDIRRAKREERAAREEARAAAAELATTAHREALAAKDTEIAYWRDRYLRLVESRSGRGGTVSTPGS